MWVTITCLGFHTLQRSVCIHEGLRWGDCAWKDIFSSPPSNFPLFFGFVRVMLLHQLSYWYCSSSLHFVASTCALWQCWVVCLLVAAVACCVCTCACVWCLKCSHLFPFWNPVSDHPSLPGWKGTALLWCCELTAVLNLTLFSLSVIAFLFQSCYVVFNFIYF